MSLINVKNLTFAYEGSYDNIFENVSFQIDTDWKLGFTGRNGRGKTTFLNLLRSLYPYSGAISAKVDFAYFPFDVADDSVMTIEAVDEILGSYEYWQLSRELNCLDMSDEILYRPFRTLSKGEQTKVMLAALFLRENSFLLIDEPTNHLDAAGRRMVSAYLRSKKGFILVSHDRAFLDGCVDHILSINKNDIQIQRGNFSSWQANKALQDSFELAENQKLQRQIHSMEAAARRTARWSDDIEKRKSRNQSRDAGVKADKGHIGAQAAKMMKRSKAAEARKAAAIREKSALLKNIERADALKLHPLNYRSEVLASFENLAIRYPDNDHPVFDGLTFDIRRGQRVALCGKNGCGKSSILKLLCGEEVPYSGRFHRGAGLKISYVAQDTSGLSGSLDDYAAARGIDITLFKTILRKLDFDRVQFEKTMEDYSGGQKKKVLIAASLCEEAHLYVWDEPLNYIDVLSRIQIEELLLAYAPTMIFVEHDTAFCENAATDVVEL